ncbi:hypothetical protein GF361_03935 [Candidatus Woesearchaeota archaeon]|nr:hypothetical protein [Candidatus Woesearchaeota archaeon]
MTEKIENKVLKANNRISLDIINKKKNLSSKLVDSIKKGFVLDHIPAGKARDIEDSFNFVDEGYQVVAGYNLKGTKKKDVIKVIDGKIDDNLVKMVVKFSPGVTFNIIRDHSVQEKFKAIVCLNEMCESRYNGTPSRFYVEDDKLRCELCDAPYTRDVEGIERYISRLKGDVYLSPFAEEIKNKAEELKSIHSVHGAEYDAFVSGKELGEDKKEYIQEVKKLNAEMQRFVLESFFFMNYDREDKCSGNDFNSMIKRRLAGCGFEENINCYHAVKSAVEFGKDKFLIQNSGFFHLKHEAEKTKEEVIEERMKDFDPKDYTTSNMIRAIDYLVDSS